VNQIEDRSEKNERRGRTESSALPHEVWEGDSFIYFFCSRERSLRVFEASPEYEKKLRGGIRNYRRGGMKKCGFVKLARRTGRPMALGKGFSEEKTRRLIWMGGSSDFGARGIWTRGER